MREEGDRNEIAEVRESADMVKCYWGHLRNHAILRVAANVGAGFRQLHGSD